MMRQMFSMGERSGLQADHFSTRILLLRSHDVVIDAVCGLARAVVKSTFVESKTSPSPKRFESESSPSPKRFESESSPSPKRFESKSK